MPPRKIKPHLRLLQASLHHTPPFGEAQESIGLIVPHLQCQKSAISKDLREESGDSPVRVESVGAPVQCLSRIVIPDLGHEPRNGGGGDVGGVRDDEIVGGSGRGPGRGCSPGTRHEIAGHDLEPAPDTAPFGVFGRKVDGRRRTVDRDPGPAGERVKERHGDRPGPRPEVEERPARGGGRRSPGGAEPLQDDFHQCLGLGARDEDAGKDAERYVVEPDGADEKLEGNVVLAGRGERFDPRGLGRREHGARCAPEIGAR